jgi:hypothetical protein
MEILFNSSPIIGYSLLFVASLSYQLKYMFQMPGNIELHNDDMWLMYGRLAQNKTLLFWGTMPGGISYFGIPVKIGFTSGIWIGVASFFVYSISTFILCKLITRIGIQPVFFVLALITGPIGLVLVFFDIRFI